MLVIRRVKISKVKGAQVGIFYKLVSVLMVHGERTAVCRQYRKRQFDFSKDAGKGVLAVSSELAGFGFRVFIEALEDAGCIRMDGCLR